MQHNADDAGLKPLVPAKTLLGQKDEATDNVCDQSCTVAYDSNCVPNPNNRNFCTQCLDSSHCLANPRSFGPTCDPTTTLCFCESNADCDCSDAETGAGGSTCVPNTNGPRCVEFGGKHRACGCETDGDCTAPYTMCDGEYPRRCTKPCRDQRDCRRGDSFGNCDLATNRCTWPDDD